MRAQGELARFVPDRGKMLVMAAGLVVFAVLAGWALAATWGRAGEAGLLQAALWAVGVICPVYAAEITMRVARGTPTLLATAEGLEVRGGFRAVARLGWDEIALIAPVEMGRKFWLAIYLHAPRETLGRLDLISRFVLAKSHAEGVPNLAFRAIQLGAGPEEAAEMLERIRQDPPRAARKQARGRR